MVKEKGKRVKIGSPMDDTRSVLSLAASTNTNRLSFLDMYTSALREALRLRELFEIMDKSGEKDENLTPLLLEDTSLQEKLVNLNQKICDNELAQQPISLLQMSTQKLSISLRTSIEDVTLQLTASESGPVKEKKLSEIISEESQNDMIQDETSHVLPFIKIVLRRTDEQLLFEQRSTTVLRGSEESRAVEEDNRYYDYITIGKGRVRRTNESEAQTIDVLYKSRDANTQSIFTAPMISYVSNFEMFDTYRNLETTTTSVEVGDSQMEITTYKVGGVDQFQEIRNGRNFKLALMVTLRILAGNVFEQEQRRFRNMILPDPLAHDVAFTYSLRLLFHFEPQTMDRVRRAISDIAFCPGNGDIMAVAYGQYSFIAPRIPETGYLCIWNIKNPVNPERKFHYNMPVVSVQFSPFQPQLLAIGLYDGSVEVRDITNFDDPPIAVSQRTETSTCDPITSIEWLPQRSVSKRDTADIEPFLALSQDGGVTKYRIINSPYMLAYQQIQLDRVEGTPEGLPVSREWNQSQSNRHPQGLNLVLHPRQHDLYYVLTDDGCFHKCSTNYPHQHLEVLQVHTAPVNIMDFSPWSPKLFLTAGNDWYIRIWMDGIFEPLITLHNEIGPVHMAAWSKTHSTVIVSNTRKAISVWDIRRSTLKPVSISNVPSSLFTSFKFARCGRSLAIGNERGSVLIMGFENMPFSPHFQYDELELAIYKANAANVELTNELKSIGFFGYPEHRRSRKHHCV